MKPPTCFKDCQGQYRRGTQLVSIIVFLILITSVNNTPLCVTTVFKISNLICSDILSEFFSEN